MYWLARIIASRSILKGIHRNELSRDPLEQFHRWYQLACKVRLPLPNAMTLSTATLEGVPSARMVLFKQYNHDGVIFYTNYESRKARELDKNPQAALTIYWPGFERQVRIEGTVHRLSFEKSQTYFQSRPLSSQLGAWASRQSVKIKNARNSKKLFKKQKRSTELTTSPALHSGEGIV